MQAATYCSFLDFNVNSQLERFGVHNGGAQDTGLLNEKWESIATVPVNDGKDGEYFVFSLSDNDFITQNGMFDLHTSLRRKVLILILEIRFHGWWKIPLQRCFGI